ncbi:MAG: Ku protein, partial [Actinomycetota bacterium]|nr:Ku protein [Actinomycetota bacterium]
ETVVLTDEDFADLPLTTSRAIDVLQFVPLEQVDPIYFAKSYYLEPDKTGTKPYVLLRQALEQSGKVALVKVALRQRESLATLRVRDGVFVLETMIWPDEVREADFGFLDEDIEVRPQELQMAGSLIDTLSGDFEPTQYTDGYREALEALIEAKVEGREVVTPDEAPVGSGTVVDLMAALRASVEAAKQGRPGTEARPTAVTAADRSTAAASKGSGTAKRTAKAAGKPATKSAGRTAAKPAAKAPARSAAKAPAKAAAKTVKTAEKTAAKRRSA